MKRWKDRKRFQGASWRRLDNTGKLFAMVTGEDLSNVFRVSAVLTEEVEEERLQRALNQTSGVSGVPGEAETRFFLELF